MSLNDADNSIVIKGPWGEIPVEKVGSQESSGEDRDLVMQKLVNIFDEDVPEEIIKLLEQGGGPEDFKRMLEDSLEGYLIIDRKLESRLDFVLGIVKSLENQKGKTREEIYSRVRVQFRMDIMTDKQLEGILMKADNNTIQSKPEYFTGICFEITERHLGNRPHINN